MEIHATRRITAQESLTVGDTHFVLLPTQGGETEDALLIHMPDAGILFVGDAFMPYFGAPFVAEGSVDGILATIRQVRELAPTQLIHGHAPLTLNFTVEILPALGEAIERTRDLVNDRIRKSRTHSETVAEAFLPENLASAPGAIVPFILMRDNVIARLYQQRTGYWKSDGEGMEVYTPGEEAAAFDLLGGGRDTAFVRAAGSLNGRGDFGMALRIADLGLAAHPSSAPLADQKQRALEGLRARYQLNPFKFLIYSEMAHDQVPEVQ